MTNKPATLEAYLEYLDRLPRKYRIEDKPVPWFRRLLRWVGRLFI